MFHICDGGRKISFLCPNGTIFRQSNLICDWWFKVDCADSPGQYEESAEHLAEDQRRAGKPKNSQPPQNFETIHTTQRRPPSNFGSEIITGHNHISDYKAEASFNSVAQSGVPASGNFRSEHRNSKPSPRSFQAAPRQQEQAKVINSRQYPTYDQSTQATKYVNSLQDEDNRRKSTANAYTYKYTPTRKTTLEYTDAAVYRASTQPSRNYKEPKETQVVAESASFVNSKSRNTYNHFSANYDNKVRSTAETSKSESYPTTARTTRPSYTTTYVPGSKNYVEVTRSVSHSVGTSTRSKPTSQVSYDHSISTTARTPSLIARNNSYSSSQYFQSTADSENNYKVTRVPTSTTFRTAKGFQLSSKDSQTIPQSPVKNSWQINLKTENATFYDPTVPTVTPKTFNVSNQFSVSTVTPKPYSGPENQFLGSSWYTTLKSDAIITTLPESTYSTYKAEPTVSEHAVDMLKTLEELDFGNADPNTDADKTLGTRTGLVVPPSAGPNTLHSLAIYFATAVDNLVSTPVPTTVTEENRGDFDTDEDQYPDIEYSDSFSSVLSQKTIDKYSNLFNNDSSSESAEAVEDAEDIANNDLELSQSRGPLSSSPQIRELAQVFTHALSAYLQDPETFRKVLSEIRPTEPTNEVTKPTVNTLAVEEVTPMNDLYSVSKDEDEVLDFSDVSNNSARPTPTPQEVTSTTLSEPTKTYSVDLIKNRLLLTTSGYHHQKPIAHSNTRSKTPASSFVTHDSNDFDNSQNDLRQGKELLSTVVTTSTKNAIAVEINGGLSVSTPKGPKRIIQEAQHTNCSETTQFDADSSYFPVINDETAEPIPRYGGFQNNSGENLSPYGAELQSFNSTPINVVFSETQTATEPIPLYWGDATSTKVTNIEENPNAPNQDLVAPSQDSRISDTLDSDELSQINSFIPKEISVFENKDQKVEIDFQTTEQPKTTVSGKEQHATFKYRSHSADRGMYYNNYKTSLENEEQLQRAHSQSFITTANQIGRHGKKIESSNKSTKNDNTDSDKPNVNVTLRTFNGANSLPTLKDILLKPTSTVPTDISFTTLRDKQKSESFTTVSSIEPTTLNTIQETTQGSTGFEESTTQYEAPTTAVYSNPSTNPQSTTNHENIWSTSAALGQIWQTTVFLDPITINDGLSNDAAHETLFPSANTYFQGPSTKQGDFYTDETSEPSTFTTINSDRIDLFKYPALSTITGAPEETTKFTEEKTTSYPETPIYESFPPIFSTPVESRNSFVESPKNQTSDDIIIVSTNRGGKSLSSAAPHQVLAHLPASEVDQTMMNKAKEMFGGLNESSANTLMNVMKKADKNTTVRRLILLLVQTCDDDHNKTIEASRTALLDALMKIPYAPEEVSVTQNPLNAELEQTGDYEPKTTIISSDYSTRRIDEIIDTDDSISPAVSLKTKGRQGKRINFDASYPNSLPEIQKSISVVTEVPSSNTSAVRTTSTTTTTTTISAETTTVSSTTQAPITTVSEALIVPTTDLTSAPTEPPTSKATETTLAEITNTVAPVVTVKMSRRGQRKFYVKTTKTPIYPKVEEKSTAAEKQTLTSVEDNSVPSDTRALELLRSLYSLAARWG